MSQLQFNNIATGTIHASASGLVRTSNTVTCKLTATVAAFEPPVSSINGTSVVDIAIVTVAGSTSVNGNDFNGSFVALTIGVVGGFTTLTWTDQAPDDTGGGGTCTQNNGFCDLPDNLLAGNAPFSQAVAQRLNHNGKFGAARYEYFPMGFYQSGNTVLTPVSPIDGYVYSRAECVFTALPYSSRNPASGFVPGQFTEPALANADIGTGTLLMVPQECAIQQNSGVLILTYYFGTTNTPSTGTVQGIASVFCHAQRQSVNPLS